ncbi:hypothetical protein D0463_09680 [Bacillus sp. V59.32b]|nr:hypothetical protein D0463_09680 [Bacillus sp. V59.32b]
MDIIDYAICYNLLKSMVVRFIKKSFMFGVVLLLIDFIIYAILQDIHLIPKLTGITGGFFYF